LGWVGGLVRIEGANLFVANFSYLFGYSYELHTCGAEWYGREVARGWMPGLICKFIPACTYSAWPETHGANRLQRFQQKDVSTRAGCINRVFAFYIALVFLGDSPVSDESKIRDVVDAVTGVAKAVPVYQDVVQPAAQEIGKALQTIAKTVHVALAPVSALVWGYDQVKEFVSTKVADRLKNVPPENIVTPKPNIAGPALESLRYTGHESSLSDLYANLLAASMDKSTAHGAHPAFVEIIKQLTPDEAKLVGLFVQDVALPLLNVRWEYKNPTPEKTGGKDVLVNFSQLGAITKCEFPQLTPTYIDNLCRLGLAEVPAMLEYTGKGVYDSLENAPEVQQQKIQIEQNSELKITIERKALRVTELGKQFARICVLRKS
jgi:hypothetical protein